MNKKPIQDLFQSRFSNKRIPLSIGIELTSRCNLNCRHCYINKPSNDKAAFSSELSFKEIDRITNEALKLGTLWIQISGGEPLLRDDFLDIYLSLKKKGFLISVLTNGTLISKEHIEVFKKYPPRSLEISIYGITQKTYEQVTRTKGSLESFQRGFGLCHDNDFDIILKTVASRLILPELDRIKDFSMQFKNVVLKIEDHLIPRIDRDLPQKQSIEEQQAFVPENHKIFKESDPSCKSAGHTSEFRGNLFSCNAGIYSCRISSEGMVHLCTTLRNPKIAYDLKTGSLTDYWNREVPNILNLRSEDPGFKKGCGSCSKKDLCHWCPALSWIETGEMDRKIKRICLVNEK